MAGSTLRALYRYPVKSMGGEGFLTLDVRARGFAFDRHWMLVDMRGRFLSQRQQPRMSLIRARVDDHGTLWLCAPDMPDLAIDPNAEGRMEVVVWGDAVQASPAGADADAWLSGFLGLPCRLVCFPDDAVRSVDPGFARPSDQVGFADGFPFLLISQASLDDLNGRLDEAVPMLRFRPNLVVDGDVPYAEDEWRRFRVGGVEFEGVKNCSRCVFTTVDPDRGIKSPDKEPLRTLSTYRRRAEGGVFFGQNLIPRGSGVIRVGDSVAILD